LQRNSKPIHVNIAKDNDVSVELEVYKGKKKVNIEVVNSKYTGWVLRVGTNNFTNAYVFRFVQKYVNLNSSSKTKDTLWDNIVPYVELMDKEEMDSAETVSFLSKFCIDKLNAHTTEKQFDTSVLIHGFDGNIRFYQGNIFTRTKLHAFVQVYDNNEDPFLLFEKDKTWKLKQAIFGIGRIEDSASRFIDYNFDGYKDVAIIWNYTAGRCSCSDPGCLAIYIYDNSSDSLIYQPELGHYLEYGISEKEKAIYLGEHCDGFYGKFTWKNGKLIKLEEYLDEREVRDTAEWKLKHYIYRNGKKMSSAITVDGSLHEKWKKQFGWPD
jgi:hypothetical protein